MKIGIEVQRLFRRRKFGIESSSLELIRTLQQQTTDHQFVIFAKDDEDKKCLLESGNLKIKTLGGKLFADFEQIWLPLAARREHVDILHCTGNTRPYFSPVPVVQTLHDVIFMDRISPDDTFYQRFGNHYRRKVVPVVTPRSEMVITVSQYEKDRIVQRLHIDPEKVQVVYNGINEDRFHANYGAVSKNSVRKKYGLPGDFILFLGNPATRKNPARVIEAYVNYATGCKKPMALVTPGLPEQYIREKLGKMQYPYTPEQFITPGYIHDADLPVLYGLSTIFLFPSISEGFGMPVIEAMACGAPVITSNISCLPEVAGDAAVLTNPHDTRDIASAIYSLSQHEEMRLRLVDAGFRNARRFSWKKSAESVLGIYEFVHQQAKSPHKTPGSFHRHVFATRD